MFERAVILAGGLGTRLAAFSGGLPKALVPIGDTPILEIILVELVRFGLKRVTLAVNYKAEAIREYFGDGSAWGVKIDYSIETHALGTMGPIKLISDLPEHFLVMNADVLTNLDFELFHQFHLTNQALFTIACCKRSVKIEFGCLQIEHDRLIGFKEKPTYNYDVSTGIYALSRNVMSYIPDNIPYGFDQLMLKLIAEQVPVATYQHQGEWLDIGNVEDYHAAKKHLKQLTETSVS